MRRLRGKLTYANVISTLCLFLLLGGGAYAAVKLPKNSVGANQLKNGAVTAAKVRNESLLARNFAPGQLPAGQQGEPGKEGLEGREGREGLPGEPGERGERGETGEPGATDVVTRYGPESVVASGSNGDSYAACESGEAVTGGGFASVEEFPANASYAIEEDRPAVEAIGKPKEVIYPAPANGAKASGWFVVMENETGSTFEFRAYVLCASP